MNARHTSSDHRQPYFGWEVDPPISVLDLARFRTLDLRLASLLWLALVSSLVATLHFHVL